jgi:hypothetical protein
MLEAANVPNQKALVTALQNWIDGLGFNSIQRVQIYAKQTGEDIPEWNDSFEVARQLEEPKIADTVISSTVTTETPKNDTKVEEVNTSKSDSGLLERAKNGDTKAIAELIKNSLQQTDVKIRATLNKGLLQVVLVSNSVPKQDAYVEAIPNLVKNWESILIDKLKVVGMREIEGSATSNIYWTQESIIVIPENEPEQLEVNEEETGNQYSNWDRTTSYEELLGIQSVRDLITHHATLSKQSMSAEEFLKGCDIAFVLLTEVSLSMIGSIVQPIYAKMGIKTGKTRSASFNKPAGKILVALLCSLARNGRKVSRVQQGQDGCVVEAVIPSDLWSWEGSLVVSVQSRGDDTYVEAATIIKGQLYDWGKSNRCLEELFSDLSMTPALM